MTTNHPANGPVSLDRLHQISEILSKAAAQSDGGNLGYAMADAVKVIDGAIAAHNEEPVAYMTYKGYLLHAGDQKVSEYSEPTPLYTAPVVPELKPVGYLFVSDQGAVAYSPTNWGIPGFKLIGQIYGDMNVELHPAPVVPDDVRQALCKMDDEIIAELDAEESARRAAMLNGGMKTIEPTPTAALDDLLSMAASAIEDLLEHTDPNTSYYSGVWADMPSKLRAAMLQAGNSPVTPDGYVLVPIEPTHEMLNAWLSEVANWRGHVAGYKAMLAAAPQQENV